MPKVLKGQKKDETKIWAGIPRKITIETLTDEKIEISLRFPARKELQIISLVKDELKDTKSSIRQLISEKETEESDQVGIFLELLPQLVIKTASILMERDEDWIEDNLCFASILKVVKPFFRNWVGIFGDLEISKVMPKLGRL